MNKIAWSPKGVFSPALTAAMLPVGEVTERQWLEALSDRVPDLAIKAGPEETLLACKMAGTPMTENPQEAGQFLVSGNWNLLEHLSVWMETQFPAKVERHNPELMAEMLEMELLDWAEVASSMVSASSLD